MENQLPLWIGFNLFILAMLALDLGVFHRNAHEVKFKEAAIWSIVWISLAMAFNAGVYYWFGEQRAVEFFTGYLIEKSLSVDNIFVFVLIFSYFSVPAKYQHRILFWGVLGALVMRAFFIWTGVTLIEKFHWMIYVFGAFLVFTGIKIFVNPTSKIEPDKNPVVRLFKKLMPVTEKFHGENFTILQNGKRFATPLFIVLILIETTDLIFAVDSIPAILAITKDPFIVYTSNVFAILGLRSLYFALAGIVHKFKHLHFGLGAILVFVGIKMLLVDVYKIPIGISLSVIGSLLFISILASLLDKRNDKTASS